MAAIHSTIKRKRARLAAPCPGRRGAAEQRHVRCLHSGRPCRGARQFCLAVRTAAGAALFVLPRRHHLRAFDRARARAVGGAPRTRDRAPLRARLHHRFRRARRQRLGGRRSSARAFRYARDRGGDRHYRDGAAFPRRLQTFLSSRARRACMSRSRSAFGAPMGWALPSPSAGRPASVRCWRRSSRSPPPRSTVACGAGLLAVYSLGLGIPFLIAAFALKPFVGLLSRMRAHLGRVEKVMGGFLVLTGIAFLGGWIAQASYWLLENFPMLSRFG